MKNTNQNTPPPEKLTALQALQIQLGSNQVSEDQGARIKKLTEACLQLGQVILTTSKPSPDQTACLRKLRELKYTLTNCIATEEFL